nr:hypothetical transcript [Hymenolepis microstoma]
MLSTHPPPPGSTMATRWMVGGRLRDSIVVSISACHVEDPGSIPGRGLSSSLPPLFSTILVRITILFSLFA